LLLLAAALLLLAAAADGAWAPLPAALPFGPACRQKFYKHNRIAQIKRPAARLCQG
jgi:hypothetical protein